MMALSPLILGRPRNGAWREMARTLNGPWASNLVGASPQEIDALEGLYPSPLGSDWRWAMSEVGGTGTSFWGDTTFSAGMAKDSIDGWADWPLISRYAIVGDGGVYPEGVALSLSDGGLWDVASEEISRKLHGSMGVAMWGRIVDHWLVGEARVHRLSCAHWAGATNADCAARLSDCVTFSPWMDCGPYRAYGVSLDREVFVQLEEDYLFGRGVRVDLAGAHRPVAALLEAFRRRGADFSDLRPMNAVFVP